MKLFKNITICLGVLALLTAAPACGDSADTTDGTTTEGSEGEGTEGEGTEGEGTEGEGTEGEGTEGEGTEGEGTEADGYEAGPDADESSDETADAGEEAGPEGEAADAGETSTEDDATGDAAGACINDDDQAIIDDPDVDVTAVATDYAYACLTDEDIGACAAAGVSADTGLSNECAYCYAEQVVCAAENCLSQCIADSEAQGCVDCRNENCVPLFEPCSGIAASTDSE